ncbi:MULTISPECIES: globin domain-containing protein [unclassified Streptomyces]|uniref:globin domain-containing protein n=1 Tax=unclassified Streptomyces TaxID=2593676 RepID=UPI00224FAA04|nr:MULTISPECIES: globin domain-containing protein [unclassified Streptomyces]MCX4989788.1 FAD-binding oxidoreductase [Streptomyces sp. NBC_00568]MCX5004972.1 FAD-binding oxidoreductase [Streptomyces sp. NBC_00638]
MFEARQTMDAPTTTSADNGTSGGNGGGGWFTPHKEPPTPSGDQGPSDGRRLAALRPVGRSAATQGEPGQTTPEQAAPGQGTPQQERISPVAEAPKASRHFEPEPAHEAVRPQSGPGQAQFGPPRPSQASATEYGPRQPHRGSPGPEARPEPHGTVRPPAPAPKASPDAVLIRRTMAEVGDIADKVTSYFYALLFVRHPELRSMFPAAMDTQRDRLLKALLTAAEHVDNTEVLVAYLQNLGRGHRKYGTRPEHYPAVGECLIGSLSRYASAIWDAEMEAAWVRTYTTISQVMIDAAAADELRAPAWWYAEVVSHDLRTPDVAVVTVRPDQPYPFLAGQYTSLETPWWPRIWRHYSFASAPRSDGLLTFHVKAVPAGWVSNALVHRARPGDVIRLGPPSGSMTVDHTTDSGLLCLGGGTGIAPIKALVEDVAEHGERRPVEVFYGARTDHDLYDIDTMLRLQQSHPWLAVRPVVDQQAHLQLPDVVREYGPWNEFDAYLSGPPGMIRSGVDTLRDIGIPSDRIRHDSVEELVAAGD